MASMNYGTNTASFQRLLLAEVNSSIETFSDFTNLPNVVSAIDGSHVGIKPSINSAPEIILAGISNTTS